MRAVVSDSATPWTVACQAPLSTGFPRQGYWSGSPFPPPGDLPSLGIKPRSPALAGRFFTTQPLGKPFPPNWEDVISIILFLWDSALQSEGGSFGKVCPAVKVVREA